MLLTSILLFVFAAIIAALSGDYSGIKAIAKIIMYGSFTFLMIYLVACKPSVFWIIVAISVIYVGYSIWKQDKNK